VDSEEREEKSSERKKKKIWAEHLFKNIGLNTPERVAHERRVFDFKKKEKVLFKPVPAGRKKNQQKTNIRTTAQ